jgi:hypothetical protein
VGIVIGCGFDGSEVEIRVHVRAGYYKVEEE